MTDIIKDAKRLLEGATLEPWEVDVDGLEVYSTVDGDAVAHAQTPNDTNLIAAAPELAQALAEEKYQYGVTYTGLKHGGQHFQWVESTGDTEWDKETLQLLVKRWKKRGQSPKIVRRRVSAPEVISE